MAAVTQLEIEKVYQGEYWVNRYHLSTDLAGSASPALEILAAERSITDSRITFTKMALRSVTPDDEVYTTSVVNLAGLANNSGNDLLPLFNVARVDFTAAVGRPSRKYLRGVLVELQTSAFQINADLQTAINTNYAAVLAGVEEYVDVDGDEIISGICFPFVAMRQLRRGSKKKSTPSSGGTPV